MFPDNLCWSKYILKAYTDTKSEYLMCILRPKAVKVNKIIIILDFVALN